ncbi:OmpA family protein [Massilia arenosa]|uniref:OmpA family protein n=1 Tax=Zemynaea arenosa TaxID=2561931 RepID=A0A4Y9SJW5_9BURK|nr:OmpA family protein [Massilia arenosa]TFW26011.1 OmpA family protein [Massilia arenosa]
MDLITFFFIAGIGAVVKDAMTPPPPPPVRERIVLLPNQDGRPSAVIVKSAKGEAVIDQPYLSATVNSTGAVAQQQEAQDQVRARYASTLSAMPQRAGSRIVYFGAGSAALAAESAQVVRELLAEAKDRSWPEVTITTYADRMDLAGNGDVIGLQRAEAVRTMLVAAGVDAQRITVDNRGAREPFSPIPGDWRNRRAEIRIR